MNREQWKRLEHNFRLMRRVRSGKETQLYAVLDTLTGKRVRHVLGLKNARTVRDRMPDQVKMNHTAFRFVLNKA